MFARLKSGVTAAQAQAELDGVVKRLAAAHPASNKELTVGVVQTFNERFNAGPVRIVFLTLMGAVGFVLLIACANVANLLLSRSTARAREVAVRYAMGATRWRVVRQLLVESLLLAAAGGVIGLGIAIIGTRLFDRAVADVGKPYWIQFTIDGVVIAYLAAICVGTSLIFGLAPALQVARTSVGSILKQGGRGSTGSRQMRGFSSALVVLELALTLVLLVGAGLMARSFMALTAVNTGIKPDHLVVDAHQPAARQLPDGGGAGAVLRAVDAAAGQPARRRRRGGDDERAAVRPVDARSAGRRPARRRPRQAARIRLRDHQPVVLRHGRRADPPRPRLRRPRRRQGRRGGDRQRAVRGAPLLRRGSDRPPHPHAGRGPQATTPGGSRSSASARTSGTATRATATSPTWSTCRSSRSARAAPR